MKTEELDTQFKKGRNGTLQDVLEIHVKISDTILTPFISATLVNEIIKGLLYQKCQIPYPYSWMKSVVNKKRNSSDSDDSKKIINFTAANHFRTVSNAYDTLESIMNGLIKEFTQNDNNYVKEVIILLGTTPQCPKEILTISVSSEVKGHLDRNHVNNISKSHEKILRNIFLSQNWMDSIDASTSCTNTYIFLKKVTSDSSTSTSGNDVFNVSRPLTFLSKIKHVRINLNYDVSDNINCCNNLSIFQDNESVSIPKEKLSNSEELTCNNTVVWYQAKQFLKGFKDCYVNKVSACDLW